MSTYFIVKVLHIMGSAILFGTGIGIAFFMLRSHYTESLIEKYYAARNTVLADTVFTLPAVILQPLTGFWLIHEVGYAANMRWLLLTYGLYLFVGICWLPVVWIQIRLKNILAECIETKSDLPSSYHRLFRIWFLLGWPAFVGLIVIFHLMVVKPL